MHGAAQWAALICCSAGQHAGPDRGAQVRPGTRCWRDRRAREACIDDQPSWATPWPGRSSRRSTSPGPTTTCRRSSSSARAARSSRPRSRSSSPRAAARPGHHRRASAPPRPASNGLGRRRVDAEGQPRFIDRRRTRSCSTTTAGPSSPARASSAGSPARGNIPLGYYKDEAEDRRDLRRRSTASAGWSPATWPRVEADGTITLLGRGSVCINSGGEKIFPEEVEAALKAHPDVFDAVVVGVPDERWGERVAAVVQPRAGRDADRSRTWPSTPASRSPATRCRARCTSSTRSCARPSGKPDYRWAKSIAPGESLSEDRHRRQGWGVGCCLRPSSARTATLRGEIAEALLLQRSSALLAADSVVIATESAARRGSGHST